ncbi:MAG: hypothetical protein AAGA61_07550 [Pseudomonadota bacterium]
MRGALTLIALAGLAVLVLAAVYVENNDDAGSASVRDTRPEPPDADDTGIEPKRLNDAWPQIDVAPESDPGIPVDSMTDPPDCLRPDQLQAHPWVVADFASYESVSSTGHQFEAYRQLSESELESLAVQNDSAAMVMLGDKAVEQTIGSSSQIDTFGLRSIISLQSAKNTRSEPVSPDQQAALESARDWYYEAALHGRIGALWQVGLIREMLEGSAVDLGWVSREEYAQLSRFEQSEVSPTRIYERLSRLARPGVADLFGGQLPTELSERQRQIIERLAEDFRQDRTSRGFAEFPPIQPAITDMQHLRDLICPSMRDQL